MNGKQRNAVKTAIGLIVFMFIFPPFAISTNYGKTNQGYSFILAPPEFNSSVDASIDVSVLLVQWVGVLIVAGLAYFLFGDRGAM